MNELTAVNTLPVPGDDDATWKFLGGLIDPDDLEGGPIRMYVEMRSYQGFVLKKEKVGFGGAFGIREANTYHHKGMTFVLWPRCPALDTPSGHIDVFDPKPALTITWLFSETKSSEDTRIKIWKLHSIQITIPELHLHWNSLDYAITIINKAKQLWPAEMLV